MARNLVCSECGGEMEEGVIPDFAQGKIDPLIWMKGPPEWNFLGMLKWMGKARYPITAYCCEECGSIKLYAELNQKQGTR